MSTVETLLVFGPILVLAIGLLIAMTISHINEVR
jgi:hypothetical protein